MATENYKNTNNKGFSIIEICIVCVVLMIAMIPIFTLMSQGNAGTVHNRNEIIARGYAANIIAYFNLISFNDVKELSKEELNSLVLENTEKNLIININDLGKDFENFKKLEFITSVNVKEFNNHLNKYKIVTVNVEWKEPNKKTATKISMEW